jgi:hypothetical protein
MKEKKLTVNRPTGSISITNLSGGAVGLDFAPLYSNPVYTSTMTMRFPSRQSRRKRKIKKILES